MGKLKKLSEVQYLALGHMVISSNRTKESQNVNSFIQCLSHKHTGSHFSHIFLSLSGQMLICCIFSIFLEMNICNPFFSNFLCNLSQTSVSGTIFIGLEPGSSILANRIPWTEQSGRYSPWALQSQTQLSF